MRWESFPQRSNLVQLGLILLTLSTSIFVGASFLIWNSPLSPLVVGGVVFAIAASIALLQNSVWVLYVAVFMNFLPMGLISDTLRSILIDATLFLALLTWLLKVSFQRRPIVWGSTSLLMAAFLIWSIVTLFWAPNPIEGRRELVAYIMGLSLLFLLVNQIDSLKTLNGLMSMLAFSGWALGLVGVGTILFLGYEFGTRLKVFDMNENLLGTLLIIALPGVLWSVMQSSGWQKALKMFLSVIFILLTFTLVTLSGSRGGTISIVTILLTFWFWKSTRPWGKLGLLILAVTVVFAPFVFSVINQRVVEAEGGSLGGRDVLWQASLRLISDHSWGGIGIGNGVYAMPAYVNAVSDVDHVGYYQTRSSHNPILDVGIDTGILGMLLYLSALASAIWLFIRQYFHFNKISPDTLTSYFSLVSCVSMGYMLSWIRDGAMDNHPTYFLLLALLIIPTRLNLEGYSR